MPRASGGTQILGSTVCRGQLASSQMSSRVGIRPGPCQGQSSVRDVFISIQGMDFESIGIAEGLVHEVVLGMDILEDAMLDLAHGLVVIPKLAFDGQLERGGLG